MRISLFTGCAFAALVGCSSTQSLNPSAASSSPMQPLAMRLPMQQNNDVRPAERVPEVYLSQPNENEVLGYLQTGGSPVLTISSGLSNPVGLATDSKGNLYVANIGTNQVFVYGRGKTKPKLKISDSDQLNDVAVDTLGNVWIANWRASGSTPGNVQEYSSAGTLEETISCPYETNGVTVAVDSYGNAFEWAWTVSGSQIFEIPAGTTNCTPLDASTQPGHLQITRRGDLVAVGYAGNVLATYRAPSFTRISHTTPIPNYGLPGSTALTKGDAGVWVTNGGGCGCAALFPYPAGETPSVTIAPPGSCCSNNFWGIAVTPVAKPNG